MDNAWAPQVDDKKTIEHTTFLEPDAPATTKRFQGWRFGVLTCTLSTCFVLLLNVCLSIGVLGRLGWGRDGQPILYQGNCDKVSKFSTVLHIFINAMSTTLLCASSYCMQCLSAPTRQELDLAHQRQSWLDIGVLSPRNIRSVSSSRRIRWLILGLSTIPLHLFYNSVVFASTGTNLYHPILIRDSLLKLDPSINPYGSESLPWSDVHTAYSSINPDLGRHVYDWRPEAMRLRKLYSEGQLERLENHDCMKSYAVQYQAKGSLFLVTNNETLNENFSKGLGGPWTKQNWICRDNSCDNSYNSSTDTRRLWQHPETWEFDSIRVAYCLAEVPPERCRLQLSLPLAIIVVFFNSLKAMCMVTLLFGLAGKLDHAPIMNIGDTVASFLDRSDVSTKNMGLAASVDLRRTTDFKYRWDTRPKEYTGTHRRRHISASKTRWFLTCLLYITMLVAAAWLLKTALAPVTESQSASTLTVMRDIGWSIPNVRTMVYTRTKDLIPNAMIANSPQLVLSWVYFSYNGLLTLLAMAREWESYALHQKGLRVSGAPQGKQRSTYFLQLPYRLAIPFMIVSALLHWLVSQSLFLVSVQSYSYTTDQGWTLQLNHPSTRVSIGYSLLPMVTGVATGSFLLVSVIVAGCMRFRTGMPVVGCCSAAMSAACQPLEEDDGEAAIAAVQWGAMGRLNCGWKHCGFQRGEVLQPHVGGMYR